MVQDRLAGDLPRIEEASLAAWPAVEEEVFDGWRLRFSFGFTKRANSVQPLAGSSLDLADKVEHCQEWYRSRGRPCVFRLTPFSDARLDRLLSRMGYRLVEPTAVLVRGTAGTEAIPAESDFVVCELDEWLGIYAASSRLVGGPPDALRAILERGLGHRLLAALRSREARAPVACGMGRLDGDLVGLFDLVTAPEHRRAGFGTMLVNAILSWAHGAGARTAYLQVVRDNAPAWRLYRKLGFEPAYEYHYRVSEPLE